MIRFADIALCAVAMVYAGLSGYAVAVGETGLATLIAINALLCVGASCSRRLGGRS